MAEEPKMTKAERREAARSQRKAAEEAAAKAAAKSRRNTMIGFTVGGLAFGGLLYLAIAGGDDPQILEDTILVSATDAEAARSTAGCEVLRDDEPLPDSTHHDPASAPPADALYTDLRPTHSGPHFTQVHPVLTSPSDSQLEERALTHNLEHGAIIAWYDPDQLSDGDLDALGALAESLNGSSFANTNSGAAIFVAPFTDPGISSGKALALRAWGNALDCDTYAEDAVLSFILDEYGTHGRAPEGNFSAFPEGVLQYDPDDTPGDFDPDADPLGESRHDDESPDVVETDASDGESETASDEPTDAGEASDGASDEPSTDASDG